MRSHIHTYTHMHIHHSSQSMMPLLFYLFFTVNTSFVLLGAVFPANKVDHILSYYLNLFLLTCGMIAIFPLTSCSPMLLIGSPSIRISPMGSAIRNRHWIRELFPTPVLPAIPIWI